MTDLVILPCKLVFKRRMCDATGARACASAPGHAGLSASVFRARAAHVVGSEGTELVYAQCNVSCGRFLGTIQDNGPGE